MFEDINEVEYALGYSSDSWSRLNVFGLGFHKMESAVKYVKSTYDIKGITKLRLRLKVSGGSVEEWDNF